MNLDLTAEETTLLLKELDHTIENDRYPLSPRIRTLKAIRAKSGPSRNASRHRRKSITSRRGSAKGADSKDLPAHR